MLELIKNDIKSILESALAKRYGQVVNVVVEAPKRADQGDISVPVFVIATTLLQPIPAFAEEMALIIRTSPINALLSNVFVMGGFINISLDKISVSKTVMTDFYQKGASFGSLVLPTKSTICIDYSSPNIAKPFSVGHLRSTIIGQAIANIYAKLGHEVIRINHLGDFGTQFGKTIYAYQHWGSQELVLADPINELVGLYVKFNELAKTDPSMDIEARRIFKELEQGNAEYQALWEWFREASLIDYMQVYETLGVKFDSYNGEAFYNDKMQPIIDELLAKGLLKEDQGAMIVDLGEAYPPALIQKSDGSTLYITRDLAALFYRKHTYDFDQCLYVVGNEQKLHFDQMKAVVRKMGYPFADNITHVNFGLILQNGKKMASRSGKFVKLVDVIDQAVQLAQDYIEAKNPELEGKDAIAKKIGTSAVIFNDLKNYRANDFEFNLEESVRFEGQTGPYLQYTSVRITSILAVEPFEPSGKMDYAHFTDPVWFEVIKAVALYGTTLEKAAAEYAPSVLAKYLLNLASLFNAFYTKEKVMVADELEKSTKKHLIWMVRAILDDGMKLLGMQVIEKM